MDRKLGSRVEEMKEESAFIDLQTSPLFGQLLEAFLQLSGEIVCAL